MAVVVATDTYDHGEERPDPRQLAMARLLHIPWAPHQPYVKQARFLAGRGAHGVVAGMTDDFSEKLQQMGIVVDDEDTTFRGRNGIH